MALLEVIARASRKLLRPGWSTAALLCLACALSSCGGGRGPATADVARHIAELRSEPRIADETLAEPAAVSRFYEARDSRPAWLDRANDVVAAIRATAADGLDPERYHLRAIESMLDSRRGAAPLPEDAAKLDILLADAVAGSAADVSYGRVRPAAVNPAWTADPRAEAPPLDSTLAVLAGSGSLREALDRQRPDHFIYRGLMGELARLRAIETRGGWPLVPPGKPLRPGNSDRRVAVVRRRLRISGEAAGDVPPDSMRFDAALARAVQTFQARHRLDSTGVVDRATVDAMNVGVRVRIDQVRANLERARWVLGGLGDDFMLVNLPAFKAYLIRAGHNVWESRTQIGEEAMQTPTFRARIRTVVFNPDWTVPPVVLEQEILQGMQAGKDVLDEKGLMIYDASNHVVDPKSIDWSSVTPETFPYAIRQPAGDDNALGKVKFLFPNPYSIYLHDTPSRQLFEADRRTFSHGCIRLEHPLELAELLLQGQDDWDGDKIERVIASDSTVSVAVERPLPILIVYWTVSVGASGEVRYAQDIYQLDPPLLTALNAPRRG